MLEKFDSFSPDPLLLCDFNSRQFGLSRTMRTPKVCLVAVFRQTFLDIRQLVDVDSLTPYRGRLLHVAHRNCERSAGASSNYGCVSNHVHCFPLLNDDVEMSEHQCVFANATASRGYCHGFDARTHVYALGKLLLHELLVSHMKHPPSAAFESAVRIILDSCTQPIAEHRPSLASLRERLKALLAMGNDRAPTVASHQALTGAPQHIVHRPRRHHHNETVVTRATDKQILQFLADEKRKDKHQ